MSRDTPVRSAMSAFRVIPNAIRLLVIADKTSLIITVGLTLLIGLGPVLASYIGKYIIDSIVAENDFSWQLASLVTVEFFIWLIWTLARHWGNVYQQRLRENTWLYLSNKVITHASKLEISFYESPTNYDILSKALSDLEWRPTRLIFSLLSSFQNLVTVISFVVVVITFNPLIGIISLIAAAPTFFAARDSGFIMFETYDLNTPDGRRAQYLDKLLTSEESAKEMRLYDLSRKFIDMRNVYLNGNAKRRLDAAKQQAKAFSASEALAMTFQYVSVAYIVYMATKRQITVGEFSLVILALSRVRQQLSLSFADLGEVVENSLFFKNISDFLEFLTPNTNVVGRNIDTTVSNAEIVFENVCFSYPGSEKPVFSDLSFSLQPQASIAIVGSNGAGKTTLVKLLLRLYEPTSGSIKYNGIDIREYNLDSYRLLFSTILQDFMKYQMTLADNIRISQFEEHVNMLLIEEAAEKSGVKVFVNSLPNTWNTFLGRQFDIEGQNLSGGQWQRVALARALYRKAPIIILDEPTSALDAEAETALFSLYKQITKGKMSILITHRFNTVKLADRIIVLEDGKIIEDGSHSDLMNIGKRYCTMYNSQAKTYMETNI